MIIYPKGSEWRKWDFHIHTPESVLNNQFGSNWDDYVQNLFRNAISEGVSAIGITDYFTIDGYKKLKREYLQNDQKLATLFSPDEVSRIKSILVFPNIEFRIDRLVGADRLNDSWNRRVNFHVLLSDRLSVEDIEERFLHQIQFESLASPEGRRQVHSLTRRNLEEFGARIKLQHKPFAESGHSDLYIGMMNATVNVDDIQNIFDSTSNTFQGKYLFALPADEDLSTVSWNSSGHATRKVLIQKSHLILSSNPNTAKFGLGEFHNSSDEFTDEFNTLKPCVWGSDAHSYERLFKPTDHRFTWVKADLTFEGLKAVVYDPIGRVTIAPNSPVSKPDYLVIDKVRFIDNSPEADQFQKSNIELNENLNAIIGGKSSGKSLLLYHIARAIDPEQVDGKMVGSVSNYSSFHAASPFDLEVVWKDGRIDKLSDLEEKTGQITYIPQLYINHLAEREGNTDLNELIEGILLQNESFKEKYLKYLDDGKQSEENIASLIQNLLRLSDEALAKKEEIKALGTEEQLKGEVVRLQAIIVQLTKSSGLTEQQIKDYDELAKEKNLYLTEKAKIEKRVKKNQLLLDELGPISERYMSTLTQTIEKYKDSEDNEFSSVLDEGISNYTADFNINYSKLHGFLLDHLTRAQSKASELVKTLEAIDKKLAPFNQALKNKEILQKEQKNLEEVNKKITTLKSKESELKKIVAQGQKVNSDIFSNYENLLRSYQERVEVVNDPTYKEIAEDLSLEATIAFDIEGFSQSFSRLFDKRGNFSRIFNQRFDEENSFIFSESQHLGNVAVIFEKIRSRRNEDLRLRKGVNEDEKYQKLFDDYFRIEYSVKYKGDDILVMSPGKRGLVLLQLILHISTATHPILIDQPEDNLDNRTIYDDLKQFVRDKKKIRQIIIVTHNANLVVSTDAECVIVANQDGQQPGKDNKSYRFEYVSGSLENTFQNETNEDGVLYCQGVKEHVCDILEGGREAFIKREQKYGFSHLK